MHQGSRCTIPEPVIVSLSTASPLPSSLVSEAVYAAIALSDVVQLVYRTAMSLCTKGQCKLPKTATPHLR